MRLSLLLGALFLCSCGGDAAPMPSAPPRETGGSSSADAGTMGDCFRDADCPNGLSCVRNACVADDGLPPEIEEPRTFLRPETAGHYVLAISPEGSTVAVIDPASLGITSIHVPDEPRSLAPVSGHDSAIILSRSGKALSYLTVLDGQPTLRSQRTSRRFDAASLSPDGKFAVLWTPEGTDSDAGAEGIVAIADVTALAAGNAKSIVERAAGRRHTDVFFRTVDGVTKDAVVVGKTELAVIALPLDPGIPVPERITLPEVYASLLTREAIATQDGAYVLLRSISTEKVGVFDVAKRTFRTLTLVASSSDLDISPDGSFAVAVHREAGKVSWFPLPAALEDASLVKSATVALPGHDCADGVDPCVNAAGQAVLSPDGKIAVLFTNARASESFGILDLSSGSVRTFDALEKLVRTIGISPDGHSAIVLHRSEPASTVADLYERNVDRNEGYSIVDLQLGLAQLKLTGTLAPQEFVFSTSGAYAAVTFAGPTPDTYRVEAVDLHRLVVSPLGLASPPKYAGALAATTGDVRIWVTQDHPAGRISFVDLKARTVRTATGFDLNSEIER